MEEASKLIGAGKKHLVMGKVVEAVSVLQEACGMLAKKYGDTADECAEAFFWCGKALLDMARMENSVLGNALEGVPEGDDEDKPGDSNVEGTENVDEKTRDELRVQVYEAMAEKPEDAQKSEGSEVNKDEAAEKMEEELSDKKVEGEPDEKVQPKDQKVAGKKVEESEQKEAQTEDKKAADKTEEPSDKEAQPEDTKAADKVQPEDTKPADKTETPSDKEAQPEDTKTADKVQPEDTKPAEKTETPSDKETQPENTKAADKVQPEDTKPADKTETPSDKEAQPEDTKAADKVQPEDTKPADRTETPSDKEAQPEDTKAADKVQPEDAQPEDTEAAEKKVDESQSDKKEEQPKDKNAKDDTADKNMEEEPSEEMEEEEPAEEEEDAEDGDEERGEENTAGEKESDDEDEVGNLQLAWEMLEVAKVIYKRKETKEDQLMAAQTHLKLGEVSAETGNYSRALEDFQECLKLQLKHLDSDSRLLAETQYQLGLTFSLNLQHEDAIAALNRSIAVIKSRLENLTALIQNAAGPDQLPEERKEMEELKALLPEIQEKVEDAADALKTGRAEAVKGVLDGASTSTAYPAATGEVSSATPGSDGPSTANAPVSDISHLVRKKRKPEESPVKEGVKKVKQETDGNDAHKTNGDANRHADRMEVESQ